MTTKYNSENRSKKQQSFINENMKQLNSAIKSKIFFAIDEYIATIFNTFFSDRRSVPGDENILNELIKYSKIIGNDRNANIINQE